MMKRRALVIVAGLIGLMVLGLTRLVGVPGVAGEGSPDTTANRSPSAEPLSSEPLSAEPGFEADQRVESLEALAGPVSRVSGYYVAWRTDSGRRVQVTGERLDPEPNFRSRITRPRVWLHLDDPDPSGTAAADTSESQLSPVLSIAAESGSFYAPQQRPKRGELQGGVTVRILQVDREGQVAAESGRLSLPSLQFDLELGQLQSAGQVELHSERLSFAGQGLEVQIDPEAGKLRRLRVTSGQWLRVRGVEARELIGSQAATDPAGHPEATTAGVNADAEPSQMPPSGDDPAEVYRFRVEDAVRATGPGVTLNAAWFELQGPIAAQGLLKPDDRQAAELAADPAANGDTSPSTATVNPPTDAATQELRLTWQGPMIIQPVSQADAPPTAPAARMRFGGRRQQPARLHLDRDNGPLRLVADELAYDADTGLLRVTGSPQAPLLATTPDLGELHAQQLRFHQATGRLTLQGPGRVVHQTPSPAASTNPGRNPGLAFQLTWRDQAHIELPPRPDADADAEKPRRFGQPRRVSFQGAVEASGERWRLASERVEVAFAPSADKDAGRSEKPNALARDARPTELLAEHDAALRYQPRDDQPEVRIAAGRLWLGLTPAPHPLAAQRFIASNTVQLQQGSRRMRCDRLEAWLRNAQSPSPGEPPAEMELADADLQRVRARGQVRLADDAEGVQAQADRMEAGPDLRRVIFHGSDKVPARLARHRDWLTSRRIELDTVDHAATCPAPGKLHAATDDGHLDVSWQDRMAYRQHEHLHLAGSVEATFDAGRDRGRISAGRLKLQLLAPSESAADSSGSPQALHRLHQLDAHEEARLAARRWLSPDRHTVESSVALHGEHLSFHATDQRLIVPGPGNLRVYLRDPPQGEAPRNGLGPGRSLSGHGHTLFRWQGRFELDAAGNDLAIDEAVQIMHQPPGEKAPATHLVCDRLRADVRETGGLTRLLHGQAPRPDLRRAQAIGSVQARSGQRRVRADEAVYDSDAGTLTLTSLPGNFVTATDPIRREPLRAQALRWELPRNRWHIVELGPTRLPLNRR